MDEMRMVRGLYPEPAPPTAREVAQARALLDEPPRRAPRQLRWGLGGMAVAGAAAVAVALAAGSTPAGRSGPTAPDPVTLDAKAAVLAAADRAAQQPSGGRYWYTDQVESQSGIVRAPTGAYAITGAPANENYSWWGVKSGMGEAFWDRTLPARPVTAADVAAWREAGSPSTFRVWAGDHYDTATTTATAWQPDGSNPHGGGGFAGGMSVHELQNLPTDPARLSEMFFSPAALAKKGIPGKAPSYALVPVAYFLGAAPLPPRVRAGLIRAMTAQPGVSALGPVTDPLGRRGIALAAPDQAATVTGQWGTPAADEGTYRWREVVILDQATGALLAQEEVLTRPGGEYAHEKPGFVIYYTAIRSQGWTNAKPAGPPAQLPLG
jgi:hypothetical protein